MNRARFYAGLFLLTLSTLMLEVIQTRLLSVVTWYHLAFFVISSAMFGMTAGAVWVYLNKERFTPDTLAHDLGHATSSFAISCFLTLAFQVTLAPTMTPSAPMVLVFAELTVAIAIPFFFSGVAVSLALTRSPFPVGIVYAVDLAGAALGCLGVLMVLQWTDAPSAILFSAALAAAAAALFQASAPAHAPKARGWFARLLGRPWALCVILALAGFLNHATPFGLQPTVVKGYVERLSNVLYVKWNSFSRILAYEKIVGPPALWGPSPRLPLDARAEQIELNIDGAAGTTMFRFDGDPRTVAFLGYDLTNLAYRIRHSGRVAVIGVGSGRDVLSAWTFGARDVTGVELNPIFVDLLRHREPFVQFAGVAKLPGVRLFADEARSWFSRSTESFDLIQMSMIDTWAATGAGAFSLSENGLYTIEGWRTFLGHLTPSGVFTVSRWHAPGEVNETGRMMSLCVAGLLEIGATEPRRHIFLASVGRMATLIVSRAPLEPSEIATLEEWCERLDFKTLVVPGREPASNLLRDIVDAPTLPELVRRTSHLDLDLTPPTDDRPFFFNLLPLHRAHHAFRYLHGAGVVGGNLIATMTLLTILVVCVVLVVITIVLPLRPALREVGRQLVAGGTAYFAFLGLGFMLVEIAFLQRLGVFLGHPAYSLSVVLFSLILTTGLGSLLSESMPLRTQTRIMLWAGATALYLILLPAWMPAALHMFGASGIVARAALSTALIAPGGLLMGFGFPTGMQLVQERDRRPTPWFWGINGASGVLASVVAVAVNIAFGIHVTMILGALCYLALIPSAMIIRRSPAHAAA